MTHHEALAGTMQDDHFLAIKRVSWAAVFAGFVVAVVVQLMLTMLGVGIGASTINPLTEASPAAGIGVGSGIWLVLSTLVSLFAGGWVAGRLSGMPAKIDGSLHGILAWGLAMIATVYLLSSAIAGIVGGTANLLGASASAVGQGMANVAPQVSNVIQDQLAASGIDVGAMRNDANAMLQEAQDPEVRAELGNMFERVIVDGKANFTPENKEAMVGVLTSRGTMPREEATAMVNGWEARLQGAQTQVADARIAAEQRAREAGDVAAKGVARTALWSFVAMLLGAIAAAFGGIVGRPHQGLAMATEDRDDRVVYGQPAHQS
jgi:ElaB/YqjD/DUF883 family membrane-anchored ribosome-binding protein